MNLFASVLETIEKNQLPFVQAIKEFRTPFFDLWNHLFGFFDTIYFFLLLIPIVWVFIARPWGIKLTYLMSFSNLVNSWIKNIFQIPRPLVHDPSLGLVDLSTSYSFPSGAAQTAVILGFLIIWANPRSIWSWIIGVNFFIWMSFARVYLGVHYPLDLFAGWCVGAVILLFFFYVFPKVAHLAKDRLLLFAFVQIGLIVLLEIFFAESYLVKKILLFLSLSTGICLGMNYTEKTMYFIKSSFQKMIKLTVCLAGILLGFYIFTLSVFSLIGALFANLFMSLWLTLFHEKILKRFS